MLQRPQGLQILAVTLHREDLRRLLDERPWRNEARALLSETTLRVPAVAMQRLRRELLALLTPTSMRRASTMTTRCTACSSLCGR